MPVGRFALKTDDILTDKVREASRKLVREFGFMNSTIASTSLAPSSLHTLLEIDIKGPQTATELCTKLNLEKSSISRLLKKLVKAGLVKEVSNKSDARSKCLNLTKKGLETVQVAHQHASKQTREALDLLPLSTQKVVFEGISNYAAALEAVKNQESITNKHAIKITNGYRSGVIGRIAYLFSTYFSHHYGFEQYFESKVVTELAEFTGRLENPKNQIWLAVENEEILGSIVIDAEDIEDDAIAHLRWFIMDERLRGTGIGQKLLDKAVKFCDKHGFKEIHLWTVKGLDAAGHLYDKYDFLITEEVVDKQWGKETTEHKRVRVHKK